jgi:hypothetical protein
MNASDINRELGLTTNAQISIGGAVPRGLAGVASGVIRQAADYYGKANLTPGNGGLFTASTTFTVPSSSGGTLKILSIGGGGGGGGGTNRCAVYLYVGGGGGGSGEITLKTVSVTPGTVLTITVGSGGSAGGQRDGQYGGGAAGGTGGTTTVKNGATVLAGAGGGSGGALSQQPAQRPILDNYSAHFNQTIIDTAPSAILAAGGAGGSGGGGSSGYTNPFASVAGNGTSYAGATYMGGGDGGRGYNINTTSGVATPYSTGSAGRGGQGNIGPQVQLDRGYYYFTGQTGCKGGQPAGGNYIALAGSTYGGGGGGGGMDNEYCGTTGKATGVAGSGGAVFIWWGY